MDPNQTPPPYNPGGYPPQTPPSGQPAYGQPAPAPAQQPTYTPPQSYQPPQSQPTAQAPQPAASWYTPAPKPNADKPGDVDSYLRAASAPNPLAQQPTNTVPGQMVGGQYSIDYLDQLAPQSKQPIEKKFIFAGIGAALALTVAAFLVFATPKTTSVANEIKLYTTMVAITENTMRSNRLVKDSQLAAINGNLQTTLVNATRDMETPLQNMGQDSSTLKSAAKSNGGQYSDTKLGTALEDARLNGVYDRVYANEMNTKMQLVLAYMASIKKNNRRESMQTFITKNEPSFKTIQESIEEFQNPDETSSS